MQVPNEYENFPKLQILSKGSKSLKTYIQDFHDITTKFPKFSQQIMCLFFVNSLPRDYQNEIQRNKVQTLEEAIHFVKIYESTFGH